MNDDGRIVRTKGLIERIENRRSPDDPTSPFFWYNRLNELGKQAQTERLVYEAVSSFNAADQYHLILKLVAKKYLTREICEIAVHKNGLNLEYVPENFRDEDISFVAVSNNGDALRSVPDSILCGEKGYELCCVAVRNSATGNAVEYVPRGLMKAKKGKSICKAAVRANGYAIEWVPKKFLSKELVQSALEAPVPECKSLWYESILSLIPEKYISKEVVATSVRRWPESIEDAPVECITPELCIELVENDPMNLKYIPLNMMNRRLIDNALKRNPRAILCLPKEKLTKKRCLDAFRRDPTIPIDGFPDSIFNYLEKNMDAFIGYEPIELRTPDSSVNSSLIVQNDDANSRNHDLTVLDDSANTIHYIIDVHLEHQLAKRPLDVCNMSIYEIKRRTAEKISELMASVSDSDARGLLLIGGDVADSIALEKLFYEQLSSLNGWRGRIISVLGNHELWDGDPTGCKPARPLDDIVDDYRQAVSKYATVLENELFLIYKGQTEIILDEQTILNTDTEELRNVCLNSTFLLLGGIGFSGLNPIYNAEMGLYRAAVSPEEDFARSERFRTVYEKVLASAKELPVVVLTHTPMEDWSNERYNPKWIYVNGHTHQNKLLLDTVGTAVFADNQVGYKPKTWHLNSFSVDMRRYDPFNDYPNGVHEISREQYIEFNRCQGIMMQGMKYPGNLYAIKHDGVYMFVIKSSSSLCLLEGGRRHKLNCDIDYYDSHLSGYIKKVQDAFTSYQRALSIISKEIRTIGGAGTVHGCIVDIDWFNHIYLNPFDGKVTPYFALDMTYKLAYKDTKSLLKSSPMPPQLSNGNSLLARYSSALDDGLIPILSRNSNEKWELAVVPKIVLDRSMYEPSRIMRSIQYIFDQNVLRVWDDKILSIDSGMELPASSTKLIE